MAAQPISSRPPKPGKRIPGKRVIWIGGRPVVLTDAELRDLIALEKKPKTGRA